MVKLFLLVVTFQVCSEVPSCTQVLRVTRYLQPECYMCREVSLPAGPVAIQSQRYTQRLILVVNSG